MAVRIIQEITSGCLMAKRPSEESWGKNVEERGAKRRGLAGATINRSHRSQQSGESFSFLLLGGGWMMSLMCECSKYKDGRNVFNSSFISTNDLINNRQCFLSTTDRGSIE